MIKNEIKNTELAQINDVVACKNEQAMVKEIISNQAFDDGHILEFIDADHVYRSWHQAIDGGKIYR